MVCEMAHTQLDALPNGSIILWAKKKRMTGHTYINNLYICATVKPSKHGVWQKN